MRAAGIGLAAPNAGSNSGLADLKHPDENPMRVPLTSVNPDENGLIHDVPISGVTAITLQISPASHGADLVSRTGDHMFAIPFARFDKSDPFPTIDEKKRFSVTDPYLQLDDVVTRFLGDGLKGIVPSVKPFAIPVRDYDADGVADDVDTDPNDPATK